MFRLVLMELRVFSFFFCLFGLCIHPIFMGYTPFLFIEKKDGSILFSHKNSMNYKVELFYKEILPSSFQKFSFFLYEVASCCIVFFPDEFGPKYRVPPILMQCIGPSLWQYTFSHLMTLWLLWVFMVSLAMTFL